MISASLETSSLNIYTSWLCDYLSLRQGSSKELDNPFSKISYLHGKEKIQYILLFYQLYNLVGHRFSLLYILDKLVMVTFWTHTITKNGYLRWRPVWLYKTNSLRYCWRCLSAKFDRQLDSKIKENYLPYSHICITNIAPQLFLSFLHFRWARAE